MNTNPLFEQFELTSGMTLRNRIVMAPMTTWSANDDATISDEEDGYYRKRAGGVGLVITGCSHVTANGIGFTDEFASYGDRFVPSLSRLAAASKSGGAPAILQIFHAGNKALPGLVPGGDVVSASDGYMEESTFVPGGAPVRALSPDEIKAIIADFGAATRRAIVAGFDGIELHGAHGFLIQNFLSSRTNQRTDEWGGSLENRMRFPLAVVNEVQRVIAAEAPRPFALGYRISPEEHGEGGLSIEESFVLVDRLADAGVDYVHASLGNVLEDCPIDSVDGKTMVECLLERLNGRALLMAAGQVRTPEQALKARAVGLDMIAIGQGLVMNPGWVAAAKTDSTDVTTALDLSRTADLAIPAKLRSVIANTPGWFAITESKVPAAVDA
ncbi:2,4-dienoyl-CoA reductase-like NADH-dependent reductase (Old Yellow Enzyme family) [Novosphingobium sp. PhB57]|uniref:NADH-dependent flavin oxidoreductase n=1 Tax=Novosphingobium sp. PhB57 TaxID=2485107 RepID=UPI0010510889|nr:NADH-dependent flavin oxidoreductase [Novosphingobium sp. PhB57]TCU54689.1 2,4-dienoyl-CoA reductase-like NADH-dependent reductase (Old Yellow Enzyme family) [Novosphingobium sp. PhB57]